jgi:beta-xylosidase
VTLLKNEEGLLPLSRDIAKIAVIGAHADSTVVGFLAYTYPAAVQQLRGTASGGGETSMAGVDGGEGAWLPPEVMAAMNAAMKAELRT